MKGRVRRKNKKRGGDERRKEQDCEEGECDCSERKRRKYRVIERDGKYRWVVRERMKC